MESFSFDGQYYDDAQGQGTLVGDTIYIVLDVQPEHWNAWTEFDVTGTAISLPITGILTGSEFMEPRVPYTFDVLLTLDVSEERIFDVPLRFDGYSDLDPAPPSDFFDEESSFDRKMRWKKENQTGRGYPWDE